ncbi:MAG TPA: hypothetical protein VFM94_08160, partial [Solirubrobacterales bacterium]|nr:hypothetical protein [Solirubrobacterales bacterium]
MSSRVSPGRARLARLPRRESPAPRFRTAVCVCAALALVGALLAPLAAGAAPPSVEAVGSPLRTATTARFDSRINANGLATTYHFEYVADSQFQASGFAGAQTTPPQELTADEVQRIELGGASGGQFRLSFGGQSTGATGTGNFTAGSEEVKGLVTSTGAFVAGETLANIPGVIPAGTKIVVAEAGRLVLSSKAESTKAAGALAADIPVNTGGEENLVAARASAAVVQAALRALPSIGGANLNVTYAKVNGGNVSFYLVTFVGALANTDVEQIGITDGAEPLVNGINAGASTPVPGGGAQDRIVLASANVAGLAPSTAYHYRLIAENSDPGSPTTGEAMTLTTRADTPLSHGDFPGPPGSDRAWEQVGAADTSGNPVNRATAISSDGNRAFYQVFGGIPGSPTGTVYNEFFAQRTESGWQTRLDVLPPRGQLAGSKWLFPAGRDDLSSVVLANQDDVAGKFAAFRLGPGVVPSEVFSFEDTSTLIYDGKVIVSDDASRIIYLLRDPAPGGASQFYDVSSGAPQLVSLLPGDVTPSCGVTGFWVNGENPSRTSHWLSPDGSLLFFGSQGNSCAGGASQLYLRDLTAASTTRISPPPISGFECDSVFVKSTPGAVFFFTRSRLTAEDTDPANCGSSVTNSDVYRYEIDGGALECVTCVVPGLTADVEAVNQKGPGPGSWIAVAEDGSRLYFKTQHHLLPGTPPDGEAVIYRVEVGSGDLAYVAPLFKRVGESVGDQSEEGEAISPDGTRLVLRSRSPGLNLLTGSQNGGQPQYYLYNDDDGSLSCASCPQDGAAPAGEEVPLAIGTDAGPNAGPLAASGDFAFVTPTALVSADQNTPAAWEAPRIGSDVYEWRDGRQLLVTDGLTHWFQRPEVSGITPSGRDLFFTATAAYTPDAPDALRRLYDARIGGGIEFPPAP